jgi:hypothetical protein
LQKVCFGITETLDDKTVNLKLMSAFMAPSHAWFSIPSTAQLAADTFRCTIATYPEAKYRKTSPAIYVPLINTNGYHRPLDLKKTTNLAQWFYSV